MRTWPQTLRYGQEASEQKQEGELYLQVSLNSTNVRVVEDKGTEGRGAEPGRQIR